jgi:hypothetical protein
MRRGAVAIIDALGFRGIWRRYPPDVILAKLKALASTTMDETGAVVNAAVPDPTNAIEFLHVAFLSDSIAIAAAFKDHNALLSEYEAKFSGLSIFRPTRDEYDAWCVGLVASMVGVLQRRALTEAPALMYRGCIAFGEFAFEQNFLVGEAVDDAAAGLDRAQGAFVWLTPSANLLPCIDHSLKGPMGKHPLIRYAVPLKGGDSYDTFCVVPFACDGSLLARMQLRAAAAASFVGTGLDVHVKQQNTSRFLEVASKEYEPIDALFADAERVASLKSP